VDVVLEDGKVVAVLPPGPRPYTVDARALTVMPGLIDAHVHWHLRGRQWGDRQGRLWLSYGITTTRSPGDPAYQYTETREALESGDRVGPRYFGTGEAVDGSRVYYNFMRPTRSVAQLALELERARALGYDMVKTYVRLPVSAQRRVIAAAHRAGMPLSSHYLYPAERIGMDGMEHTGATNRLGYSHTVSRLGRAYEDAVRLFVRSGMSITPTLFNSSAIYDNDRHDPGAAGRERGHGPPHPPRRRLRDRGHRRATGQPGGVPARQPAREGQVRLHPVRGPDHGYPQPGPVAGPGRRTGRDPQGRAGGPVVRVG
jgi:hypothetical protein